MPMNSSNTTTMMREASHSAPSGVPVPPGVRLLAEDCATAQVATRLAQNQI